jgi:rSAM/selenodomain-associated transferase 1
MARGNVPRRLTLPARYLVIMAKSPFLGTAKRRLAADIGDAAAIRFYRACLSHACLRLAQNLRWRTLIAVTPDRDVSARFWPRGVSCVAQGRGDLGQRMQRIFQSLPPGLAIIVGSDIPGIRATHIADAFKLLGHADAVFGPAPDGGYWLVGLMRKSSNLKGFTKIRWSSPHALADTVAALEGKRLAFAATLTDIDDEEAYRSNRALAERLITRSL